MSCTALALLLALTPGSIAVSASLDRAEVLVGQEVCCTITIQSGTAYEVVQPPAAAFLSSFIIKDMDQNEEMETASRTVTFEYVLAAFVEGAIEVPAMPISYLDPDGNPGFIHTRALPLVVGGATVSLDDDPKDIRDVMDLKPVIWPWVTGVLVLLAALSAWLIWRRLRRTEQGEQAIARIAPWTEALENLARLAEAGYLARGDVMTHTVACSEILRRYVEGRYRFPALELPTEEVLVRLQAVQDLDNDVLGQIRNLLTDMDLVKFARANAGEPEAWPRAIRDVVLFTRPSDPEESS